MHDSRQRRSVARGVDAKSLVRNAILLVVAVTVAFVLIPADDNEDAPSPPAGIAVATAG